MAQYKFNESKTPLPNPQARRGEGRMPAKEFADLMRNIIDDAVTYVDDELTPMRAEATRYYHGELFGNEDEGRSQTVITEVRDTILGVKPGLLRKFFGTERVLEFCPKTEQGVAKAKQATDYVQHIFAEKNPGFMLANSVLDDGLIRKLGAFQWDWVEGDTESCEDEGVTQDQLFKLAARDEVDVISVKPHEDDEAEPGDEPLFDVVYSITHPGGVKIWALAGEEFLTDRNARDIETALFVGRRSWQRRGDLIALGIDEDLIDKHGGAGTNTTGNDNEEARERNSVVSPNVTGEESAGADRANDLIEYIEGYPRVDFDGDGKLELRKVCTIGPGRYVVHNKPCKRRKFAAFVPVPEAHTISGLSYADLTMDLQRVKSDLTRGMLDSFALSIYPRTAFVEGLASVEDILNPEIGAPIRMKKEGAVQPFNHVFTGEAAMPILNYFEGVGESRTGRNKGAMSMDADALQSSTKQAVQAAVTSSQAREELLAFMFAEQTLKPMFRGIYQELVENKPEPELVRLRGSFVNIDVTEWEANLEVTVAVALGQGLTEQRIEHYEKQAARQEQILQLLGPDNPLVTVAQYRNTLAKIVELGGDRDVSAYYKEIPPDWQPPPPPPPQPSPEEVLAQAQLEIERMRIEKELEIKTAELLLKKEKQDHDMEMAEQKLAHDVTLRRYEIDARYMSEHTRQQEELDAAAEKAAFEIGLRAREQQHAEDSARAAHALAERQQNHAEQSAAAEPQAEPGPAE